MIGAAHILRGVLAGGLALSAIPGSPSAGAATFGELLARSPVVAPDAPVPGTGAYAPVPRDCPPDCDVVPAGPMAPQGFLSAPAPGTLPGNMPGAVPIFVPQVQADPRAFLPLGLYADAPGQQLQLWSYGQFNATTDPFDPWGFSTPYMYVPWSTPLSGWANAATWNWWRERSGALPRNW